MKKVILLFTLAFLFVGCTNEPIKEDIINDNCRFQCVYWQSCGCYKVIVDKETGVEYLYVDGVYGGGLTRLEKE